MQVLKDLDIRGLTVTAREAGRAILDVYETDFEVRRKSDASPVTEADLRADRVIRECLEERYPGVPVLSEENSEQAAYEERHDWPCYWLVDPLDGTKEFIKRNGQFTVNIALIEGGRPVAGVVFAPALELLYYAINHAGGQEAFKVDNGGPAVRLDTVRLDTGRLDRGRRRRGKRLVIAGSLSHSSAEMTAFVEEQKQHYEEVKFIAMGSSLKICLVAEGGADIYPRLGPTMEWDTAAAHAVANAAGRRVLEYQSDRELRYNKRDLHNPWFIVE